ncbi:hypothetical protein CXF61_06350 [Psychrobacter sp. 4Dc]|uniref:hypothetical protein n=1 Tax=Psychrobacter sp. 4Dc TaxID=888437 RepID=UPI000CC7A4D3|nr:hypothetical protein [Psychrobacter sp. 4Dc]PKH65479.1 hypothetical protein CXF61_06350 [Psychrobacter sp. 4Dc]
MKKTVFNTALSTALIVALGVSVSACSGGEEHEEVMAIDRVDEAAELAIKNAPPAEEMEFPETAPMPAADAAGTEAGGTATAEAGTADADTAEEAAATDSTDTAAAPTDSADMAATDDTAVATAE